MSHTRAWFRAAEQGSRRAGNPISAFPWTKSGPWGGSGVIQSGQLGGHQRASHSGDTPEAGDTSEHLRAGKGCMALTPRPHQAFAPLQYWLRVALCMALCKVHFIAQETAMKGLAQDHSHG